ncbi:hypothetical protein L1987_55108 [Smallanthus sonchifolius]|uniref:Uncharacterized protein n=1 Tax=Smallanthus sonchifolius TaxID=185202 RepID=A0ACB9E908_9ASTR|nr:hypothetical protein L1987_55108 [Smallanthus sonchifolius]
MDTGATRGGNNNNNTRGVNGNAHTGSVTTIENHEGYSYKSFEGCKHKPFDGKKGAIDTTQWITKIEAVIKLSECRSDQAVKFATNSLETTALDRWEFVKQARGDQAVENMKWNEFKELIMQRFCPQNELDKLEEEFQHLEAGTMTHQEYATKFDEMSKLVPHLVTPEPGRIKQFIKGLPLKVRTLVRTAVPQTMDSALALSATVYDDVAAQEAKDKPEKAVEVKSVETKRKSEEMMYWFKPRNLKFPRREGNNAVRNPQEMRCGKCQKSGHVSTNCPSFKCYNCNEVGHLARNCTKPVQQKPSGGAKGRVFVIGEGRRNDNAKVIAGTFLVNGVYAKIMFDTGANRTFVSDDFSLHLGIKPTLLERTYCFG